jgi:hypothetical protein
MSVGCVRWCGSPPLFGIRTVLGQDGGGRLFPLLSRLWLRSRRTWKIGVQAKFDSREGRNIEDGDKGMVRMHARDQWRPRVFPSQRSARRRSVKLALRQATGLHTNLLVELANLRGYDDSEYEVNAICAGMSGG